MAFDFKKLMGKGDSEEEYVEIDVSSVESGKKRIVVKPFTLRTFDDTNPILSSLRDGYTIAIIDIKPLKTKDIIELKRSIAKIKKTVDAIEGSIAGFGEHTIIATPDFAEIHRTPVEPKKERADYL